MDGEDRQGEAIARLVKSLIPKKAAFKETDVRAMVAKSLSAGAGEFTEQIREISDEILRQGGGDMKRTEALAEKACKRIEEGLSARSVSHLMERSARSLDRESFGEFSARKSANASEVLGTITTDKRALSSFVSDPDNFRLEPPQREERKLARI